MMPTNGTTDQQASQEQLCALRELRKSSFDLACEFGEVALEELGQSAISSPGFLDAFRATQRGLANVIPMLRRAGVEPSSDLVLDPQGPPEAWRVMDAVQEAECGRPHLQLIRGGRRVASPRPRRESKRWLRGQPRKLGPSS